MTKKQDELSLQLDIHYSLELEKFIYKFYSRVDAIITFAILFLGTSTIFSIFENITLGFWITFLTILQISFRLNDKVFNAKDQYNKYSELKLQINSSTEEELKARFLEIHSNDSKAIGILKYPAKISSRLLYGYSMTELKETQKLRDLTKPEKIIIWLIGEKFW